MEGYIKMDKKHLIITSVTLGVIAASSALLIGVTNLITKDKISQNEKEKIVIGIKAIFGSESKVTAESSINESIFAGEYKYINYVYTISDNSDVLIGYAFKTSGSNNFGKITMLVGYTSTKIYKSVYMISDEQTFASTLEDEYVAKITDNPDYQDVDVHCGATYGATLVKEMIDEVKGAVNK